MSEEILEDEVEEEPQGGINVTPLVDVALTLVLVFLVTMPLSVIHGINARKLAVEKFGLAAMQETIQVHLTTHGIYILDKAGKEKAVPYNEFGTVLSQMIQVSTLKHLLLQADRNVPHGQTVWVMDLGKQNGANEVSLLESKR